MRVLRDSLGVHCVALERGDDAQARETGEAALETSADGGRFEVGGGRAFVTRDGGLERLSLAGGPATRLEFVEPLAEGEFYHSDVGAFVGCVRSRGVGVLRGALSDGEVEAATDACWEWLERASQWRRSAPSTWTRERGGLASEAHGVVFFGGQCEGSWLVRGSRGVRHAFAALWGGETNLIASMEPLIVWPPWDRLGETPAEVDGSSRRARRTSGGWLHYDDDEPLCDDERWPGVTVQGLASLTTADAATGGFVCVPDSHDTKVDVDRPRWRYVPLRPGDLVCWDGRTLHASEPGCDSTAYDPSALLRLAVPVCLVPRDAADPAALQQRRDLHARGGTSTHRPHRPDLQFARGVDPPAAPLALNAAALDVL